MPKGVIDFDALWASDKLAACAEWSQVEYAWLYGLADASGSFEMTNLRVIWGRVAAIRSNFTMERLAATFEEFIAHGLLFTWCENGKCYGHWTGSDVPGRLPPPSWRARLERLAPPVPQSELAAYVSRFGARNRTIESNRTSISASETVSANVTASALPDSESTKDEIKPSLEAPQAQEWDLNSKRKGKREETQACVASSLPTDATNLQTVPERSPEELLWVFEEERGGLPPATELTPELRRQCEMRIAAGLTRDDFCTAVRRAAATPFLSGSGQRGWRATFDWLMANDANVRKILEGRYEPARMRHPVAEVYTGTAPVAAAFGARVSAAALERIRARERILPGNRSQTNEHTQGTRPASTTSMADEQRQAALRKGVAQCDRLRGCTAGRLQ